jgi:hypothetical protein
MATLQIRKKSNYTWLHIDSDLGEFILSQFYFSEDIETFQIVEQGQSKRRVYNVANITVYDDTGAGTPETFVTITALSLRLEELFYPAFDFSNISPLDPTASHYKGKYDSATITLVDGVGQNGDYWQAVANETVDLGSGNISLKVGDYLHYNGYDGVWEKWINNNQTTSGASILATVLAGLSAASGTFTSSNTILEAFGKAKYLIDNIATTYQALLVSGTNIKTLDGDSLLGSGNQVSKAFVTVKTTTSASLATQDIAGFLTYVNAVASFAIAKNEIVKYNITDTGQIFEIIPNNILVGSGQSALVSSDILEVEHADTILQHIGVWVKFNQAASGAYPFAGGQLNSGTLQSFVNAYITPYSNSFVKFIAASGINNSGYRFSDGNSYPAQFFKGTTFFGIINPIVTTNLSAIVGMPHAASISGVTENTTIGAWFNITGATIQAKCANASSVSTGTSQAITATEWLLCMIEVIDNDAVNKRVRFKVKKIDGTVVYNEDITANVPAYNTPGANNSTGVRAILATTPGSNTDIFGLQALGFWAAKPNWLKYF